MSSKLKFYMFCLILVAGFLGFRVLGLFNGKFGNSEAINKIKSQNAALISNGSSSNFNKIDSDKDGLPDSQETYYETNINKADSDGDGYLDGEEVLSGYNPAKNGDDKINKVSSNLTQSFANNLISGMLSGSLVKKTAGQDTYDKSMNLVALTVLDEAQEMFKSEIKAPQISVISNTQENFIAYQEFLQTTLDNEFWKMYVNQDVRISKAVAILDLGGEKESKKITSEYSEMFSSKADMMDKTLVPDAFKETHESMIIGFRKLARDYQKLGLMAEDPMIGNMAVYQIAVDINEMQTNLAKAFRNKLDKVLKK